MELKEVEAAQMRLTEARLREVKMGSKKTPTLGLSWLYHGLSLFFPIYI